MFGLIVGGRAVQTNPQMVTATQYVFTMTSASTATHIVVFLLNTVALAETHAAAVYISWPQTNTWRFLGALSNAKQSAVFRIRSDDRAPATATATATTEDSAQIGISVETTEQVEATMARAQHEQGASLSTQSLAFESKADLPRKVVENFFEFATSYATSNPAAAAVQSAEWIPAWVLSKWYQNILSKLQKDPSLFR